MLRQELCARPRDQATYGGSEKRAIKKLTLNDNICNTDIIWRGNLRSGENWG